MTWPTRRLTDLCEINIGRTPSRSTREYWDKGWPWLSIADMNQGRILRQTKEQISSLAASKVMGLPVQQGTVALSFKLSIGKVGIVDLPMFTNEAIATLPIRDKNILTTEFLYWALRTIELTRDSDDAVMGKTLNKAKLARIPIPLPPVEEQLRIVEVLDRVDELRAKRREAIALLDDLTQSIFLDTFGDPIENDRGWPYGVVGDFTSGFESGKSFASVDESPESKFRILKISAVTSGRFDPSESKPVPPEYSPPVAHLVRKGDLLFSRANTSELVGATALVGDTPANLLLPDKLWRFSWKIPSCSHPLYVRQLFRQPKFRNEISSRATGSSGSMKNISQAKVLSIECGLPPLALQETFAERVTYLESLRVAQSAHLGELDELFASVQQRAFRGDLWEH